METRNGVSIEAQVYPIKEPRNNTLAMASLTIGGCFAVRGVKVMQGKNGPFVSMPQARDGKGEWHDVCFPTSKDVRDLVTQMVMEKYNALRDKAPQQQTQQPAMPRRDNRYPSR